MTPTDSIWAKVFEAHADSLQGRVDSLQAKLEALQNKTDLLYNIVETANDGVNNQLSAANNLLALVAVIMAVAGIWLGIYIGKKKREIETMANTVDQKKKTVTELAKVVDEKKEKVDIIAKATEDLDKKIHGDLTGLYNDLRKEETNALLDRLITEPYDICNLADLLASRELGSESYSKLKEAYIKFQKEENEMPGDEDGTFNIRFVVLFFQHFCFQSLNDEDIAPSIRRFFYEGCCAAFKRDIKRSTIGLCKAISDENSTFNKEEILVDFLKALNASQHKNNKELMNIFEQNITPQTLLQSAIERCTKDQVYLELFGKTPPNNDTQSAHQ